MARHLATATLVASLTTLAGGAHAGAIEIDLAIEHVGIDLVPDIGDNRTIRLWAVPPSGHRIDALAGNSVVEWTLEAVGGSFYQHPNGGWISQDVNSALFPFFPELEHDSYFTIGRLTNSDNALSEIGVDPASFEAGGPFSADNGSIFVLPADPQGVPVSMADACGTEFEAVLIGQFTLIGTDTWLEGSMLIQGRDGAGESWQVVVDHFTLGHDCDRNGVPDECDLVDGDSDCNGNGILDACESGDDCNNNGIPDSCETDCDGNGSPDDCDIAGGAGDCNGNGIPDACELGDDCNSNGIPDTCETDCDGNGVPDDCDIAGGAEDCNGNGILDPCEGGDDCNGNGILDECEADCDANGVPDDCDLAGGAPDCDGNGVIDVCDMAGGAPDCDGDGVLDTCELDGGEPDCNGNGTPDQCDLDQGDSEDVDANGVPDECDPDCNENGIPDALDIDSGDSDDGDGNGVPDECECADVTGDESVGIADLLQVLEHWHDCPADSCQSDLDGDGDVGLVDLLMVVSAWGDCPA